MKNLMLAVAALLVAGSSYATVPDWLRDNGDASVVISRAKAKASKMKTPDATVVAAPQGLAQISAGEGGHLLELARRIVERGDVTLAGKVGTSDKYDAYACEDAGTSRIAAVAKAQTCTRVFESTGAVIIVGMEVLADLHADGSRSIKGIKIFSGRTHSGSENVIINPEDGLWISGGRVIEYTTAQQLTRDGQGQIKENLDVWERMAVGMMGLDDECYYANGGTCG